MFSLPSGKLLVLLRAFSEGHRALGKLYPDDLLALLFGGRFELWLLIEFDLLMILSFLAESRACFIDALPLFQSGLQNGTQRQQNKLQAPLTSFCQNSLWNWA